jgi:hypothetical protein
MTAKLRKKCRNCTVSKRVSGCLFGCNRTERVVRELNALMADNNPHADPILEQLRLCPEAFQAGELVGKMFDGLKYGGEGREDERCLPPAGAVMPPLV